jgi:hypothetical protein
MLLEELERAEPEALDLSRLHSRDAPDEFTPSQFFDKYKTAFVPPMYAFRARRIESRTLNALTRQWAFEYQCILEEIGLRESEDGLRFRGRQHEEHYGAFNSILSEVYRSGYLRALAWAVTRGHTTEAVARELAAEACPVNIDLWRVRLSSTPPWWPRPQEPAGEIDTVAAEIWRVVRAAWEVQREATAPRIAARAGGRVHEGRVVYDLEIFGAFQRAVGSLEPEAADVTEMLSNVRFPLSPSGVRFAADLGWVEPEAVGAGISDWIVAPASAWARPASLMQWQPWRSLHGVVLPMPYLAGQGASVRCTADGVEVTIGDQVVAVWRDWSFRRQEVDLGNLTPSTAFVLEVNSDPVEAVEASTGMAFCWVCRLTGFHREHTYSPYQRFSDHRVFGSRRVVLPHRAC